VLATASILVVAALAVATYRTVELSEWQEAATRIGSKWAAGGGERLVEARFRGDTLVMVVQGAGGSSRDTALRQLLKGSIPAGTPLAVDRVHGAYQTVGGVGSSSSG
jgi:hypothetical protein